MLAKPKLVRDADTFNRHLVAVLTASVLVVFSCFKGFMSEEIKTARLDVFLDLTMPLVPISIEEPPPEPAVFFGRELFDCRLQVLNY